jgi:3-oxoacyl-[acyl-carrier-protein] synthase III
MAAVLEGIGAWLPSVVVTNDELCAKLGVSPDWITSRTGIVERRRVSGGEATVELAVESGSRALRSAGRTAVDVVLLATTSPDRVGLPAAPEVAHRLGVGTVAAFDVNSACSGFVYGLTTAAGLIDIGVAESVLLIGAEAFSSFVDPLDPNIAPIFGDGAGAVVLRRGGADEDGAFGPFDLGSDGAHADLFAVNGVGARHRSANGVVADLPTRLCYVSMAGRALYKQAVARMAESARSVLAKAGRTADEIDCFVGHQANIRILRAVAEQLGLPAGCVATNIGTVGNTLAASIPVLLGELAVEGGRKPGASVLVTAFGAGLSWGSTMLTWPDVKVEEFRHG